MEGSMEEKARDGFQSWFAVVQERVEEWISEQEKVQQMQEAPTASASTDDWEWEGTSFGQSISCECSD